MSRKFKITNRFLMYNGDEIPLDTDKDGSWDLNSKNPYTGITAEWETLLRRRNKPVQVVYGWKNERTKEITYIKWVPYNNQVYDTDGEDIYTPILRTVSAKQYREYTLDKWRDKFTGEFTETEEERDTLVEYRSIKEADNRRYPEELKDYWVNSDDLSPRDTNEYTERWKTDGYSVLTSVWNKGLGTDSTNFEGEVISYPYRSGSPLYLKVINPDLYSAIEEQMILTALEENRYETFSEILINFIKDVEYYFKNSYGLTSFSFLNIYLMGIPPFAGLREIVDFFKPFRVRFKTFSIDLDFNNPVADAQFEEDFSLLNINNNLKLKEDFITRDYVNENYTGDDDDDPKINYMSSHRYDGSLAGSLRDDDLQSNMGGWDSETGDYLKSRKLIYRNTRSRKEYDPDYELRDPDDDHEYRKNTTKIYVNLDNYNTTESHILGNGRRLLNIGSFFLPLMIPDPAFSTDVRPDAPQAVNHNFDFVDDENWEYGEDWSHSSILERINFTFNGSVKDISKRTLSQTVLSRFRQLPDFGTWIFSATYNFSSGWILIRMNTSDGYIDYWCEGTGTENTYVEIVPNDLYIVSFEVYPVESNESYVYDDNANFSGYFKEIAVYAYGNYHIDLEEYQNWYIEEHSVVQPIRLENGTILPVYDSTNMNVYKHMYDVCYVGIPEEATDEWIPGYTWDSTTGKLDELYFNIYLNLGDTTGFIDSTSIMGGDRIIEYEDLYFNIDSTSADDWKYRFYSNIPEEDLLIGWRMKDSSIIEDFTDYNINFIAQGTNFYEDSTSVYGNALFVDTNTSFRTNTIDIPLNFGNGDISFSLWIKSKLEYVEKDISVIFGWNSSDLSKLFGLFIYSDNLHFLTQSSSDLFLGPGIACDELFDDQWHHIVAVRKYGTNGYTRLYIDSQLIGEDDENLSVDFSNATFLLLGENYKGSIEEPTIWNKALTEKEIYNLNNLDPDFVNNYYISGFGNYFDSTSGGFDRADKLGITAIQNISAIQDIDENDHRHPWNFDRYEWYGYDVDSTSIIDSTTVIDYYMPITFSDSTNMNDSTSELSWSEIGKWDHEFEKGIIDIHEIDIRYVNEDHRLYDSDPRLWDRSIYGTSLLKFYASVDSTSGIYPYNVTDSTNVSDSTTTSIFYILPRDDNWFDEGLVRDAETTIEEWFVIERDNGSIEKYLTGITTPSVPDYEPNYRPTWNEYIYWIPANQAALPTDKIVGLWRCEDDGNLRDRTKDTLYATLVEGSDGEEPEIVDGIIGNALSLSGDDYYYSSTDIPLSYGSCDLTISVWVLLTSSNNGKGIVGWYDATPSGSNYGRIYAVVEDGCVKFTVANESLSATVTSQDRVDDGVWHQITLVRKYGSYIRIYIDGVYSGGAIEPSGLATDSITTFKIGTYLSSTQAFEGYLDDVIVWNSALTQTEVSALYKTREQIIVRQDGVPIDRLVRLWHCENASEFYNWVDLGYDSMIVSGTGTSVITGKDNFGQAISLNGNSHFEASISVPRDFGVTGFSISIWIYPISDSSACGIVGWGNLNEEYGELDLYLDSGILTFKIRGMGHDDSSTIFDSENITLNQWTHVVATRDYLKKKLKLYKNGVLISEVTEDEGNISDITSNLLLGINGYGDTEFVGALDDLAIFNRALTDEEVLSVYNLDHELIAP